MCAALNVLAMISFYDNQEPGRLYWFLQDGFQNCDQFISPNYRIKMIGNSNCKVSDSSSPFKIFLYFKDIYMLKISYANLGKAKIKE